MATANSTRDFYVYLHRKATTGEVFYVGKGFGRRAWDKSSRNRHWKIVAQKHGLVVEIVHDGLQEWSAFEMESGLIALYGRKDTGMGPLVNYTDGGEGSSGVIQSEETRAKKSQMRIGKKHSDSVKRKISEANRLTKSSKESRERMSYMVTGEKNPMFGKKVSNETRKKQSASHKGRKDPRAMPVHVLELGISFRSPGEAVKYMNGLGIKISKSSVKAGVKSGARVCGHTFSIARQ